MTEKIYESQPLVFDFEANVISCEKGKKYYEVVLDRTAFFPEGGGQFGDSGEISGVKTVDTQIRDGRIIHLCLSPVGAGRVSCSVDRDTRFRNMQSHTGEHILSGLAHTMYGCTNVGFHLGRDKMTVDFDIELTAQQLEELEKAANDAVFRDLPVTCFYPSPEELSALEYRSKLELTENVRLVRIGDVDLCACCAPHLPRTSMVGLVKIVSRMRWKGGVRLDVICGLRAIDDYSRLCEEASGISAMLSCERRSCSKAAEALKNENEKLRLRLRDMSRAFAARVAAIYDGKYDNLCVAESSLDDEGMRELANILCERTGGLCSVLCGDDEKGYSYIIRSDRIPLKKFSREINEALGGRGGGDDRMLRGRFSCTAEQAEAFFAAFTVKDA